MPRLDFGTSSLHVSVGSSMMTSPTHHAPLTATTPRCRGPRALIGFDDRTPTLATLRDGPALMAFEVAVATMTPSDVASATSLRMRDMHGPAAAPHVQQAAWLARTETAAPTCQTSNALHVNVLAMWQNTVTCWQRPSVSSVI